MVAVSDPPLFVAVMVYVAAEEVTVGVPEMTPVEPSMFNPEGSEGEMLQVALSPEFEGVMEEMATSLLKVNGEPE